MLNHHILEIEKNGYTILKREINALTIKKLKDKILNINNTYPVPAIETTPRLNRSSDVVYNLEQKDRFFSKLIFQNKNLRNILIYFLNDEYYKQIPQDKPNYILRSMIARSSASCDLPLHIDSFIPNAGKRLFVIQASVIIDKHDSETGTTVVVPSSHLSDEYANQNKFKNAITIESDPGDIVLWDSRLWHGALSNKSHNSRWALIATFTRWWIKQNYDIVNSLPLKIYNDLSLEEKSIMGYCSSPPKNEYDRIDIKAGYEILEKK
jgi:ectoine hydroxylase-related dioxygenase (phytanoyl-CoA dioxygenase family)